MNGYLKERYGNYYIVIQYKDNNKNWKKKWISTGLPVKNNKRYAEKLLKDTLDEYKAKEAAIEERKNFVLSCTNSEKALMPFVDYINSWLSDLRLEEALQENTIQFYESMCNNHIIPFFERLNLSVAEISRDVLQEFLNHEKSSGNKSLSKSKTSGLSPSSMKHLRTILTLIIGKARKERIITDNPCEFLSIPKIQKRDVSVYNDDEICELLDKLKDEEIFPIIYVTLFYGLRRSEVCGLQWDSVNFKSKTVTIKHTVVRFSNVLEKDTTKNESSHRTYPLSPEIEDIFLKQKEKQREGKLKYKEFYSENEYIFKKESGEIYNPDYVSRKFSQLLKKYDLKHIRFHDLRHSCASLLISNGCQLKDIQEWLGHSDIQTTANIYAHLDQSRKMKIMGAMQNYSVRRM